MKRGGILLIIILLLISFVSALDTNQPQVVGWRTSDYGTEDPTAVAQENFSYYIEVAKGMALKFPGSRPGGIYTIGYIDNDEIALPSQLESTIGDMNGVHYDSENADPEIMLTAFDAAGLDIILSIEPGTADVNELAAKILDKYKQHSSVKGFGLDAEWYKSETGEVVMTAEEAISFRDTVKSVNPNYKVLIKHYDSSKLPKGIKDITYLTDTCGFDSKSEAIAEYVAWADYFSNSEVAYQFGYDKLECGEDSNWWKALAPSPGLGESASEITAEIRASINNSIYGVYWADFTILTQFPINYTAGKNSACYQICIRPSDLCIESSVVSNSCGGYCTGNWTVAKKTIADADCNGKVNRTEFVNYMHNLMTGKVSSSNFGKVIIAWILG